MRRDPRTWLWDVREAAIAIESFVSERDADGYAGSPLVHSAVERKFEIIGEALNQLSKADPALAAADDRPMTDRADRTPALRKVDR